MIMYLLHHLENEESPGRVFRQGNPCGFGLQNEIHGADETKIIKHRGTPIDEG